ncbi:metal-dependent hydrolase [Spongiivirga sp. MCCC 1A20706]|uniref:metal-dependent hydrolase n=1 Tax=Spongiivirga sp. MCCC 1A20706 TaxID=3160963 RepID=UPI003977C00D
MKITAYGHGCIGIETGTKNIIIDPFITENPLAKEKIKLTELKADFILVTHAHFDHTADVDALAKHTGAIIVSNYEIAMHYQAKGHKVHPMNHGGAWNFDFGKVKYVNAVHTSSFGDGTYGGQPGGFVMEADKNIYIAGDTALTMDMKLIPMQTALDLAVFPIGDNFTMGVDDAVVASDFVECNRVLGIHYDTFGYIEIDKEEAKNKFSSASKELILLEVGSSIEV